MANFKKTVRCTILALLFLAIGQAARTQGTASPFDLLPRVKLAAPTDTVAIAISSNPFDIAKGGPATRQQAPRKSAFRVDTQRKAPLTVKEKATLYKRFLFVVVLSMFIILTLVVTVFRILIEKIWKAFLNDNLLSQLLREQGSGIALAYIILYLLFFINAGIFLFLATNHFGVSVGRSNLQALFISIGGIAGFFIAKHFILWLLGFVFPIGKEVGAYQFTIMIFNITIGLLLVPFILFAAYAPQAAVSYVVYAAIGLLLLTYLFLSLRGLFIANRFLAWHRFHFFLYLCAVEIAPVLLIAKMLLPYWGQ